jgi:energy-converting hydrogenase B subunit Q
MQGTAMVETLALAIEVEGDGHALGAIAEVVAAAEARITWISILDAQKAVETILVELAGARNREALIDSLRSVPGVRGVAERLTLHNIFGKRIVVIGGGSQVGQVVLGAVSEADRHNLRGERISIDTIPLVGEEIIAEAVRATARLPRVEGVVLAGALMGGEIEEAVREVRAKGLLVISLNMAGSVPDAADLVVTDPVQAGVMAVMAVAHTARFDIRRIGGRRF